MFLSFRGVLAVPLVVLSPLAQPAHELNLASKVSSVDFDEPYDARSGVYARSYFLGQAVIGISACRAVPESGVSTFSWRVTGESGGAPLIRNRNSDQADFSCDAEFVVPAGENYIVDLKVIMRDGDTSTGQVAIPVPPAKLIVSVGDSYAAGEGVPDAYGEPRLCSKLLCKATTLATAFDLDVKFSRKPRWLDAGARRSLHSGPARAARGIARENGPVTFITYARSGSKLPEMLDQLKTIDRMRNVPHAPRIDALIVSFGGNEVGFAPMLQRLAMDKTADALEGSVRRDLARLRAKLDLVADRIARLNPRVVIWTGYPTSLFEGADGRPKAGCGVFDTREERTGLGIGVTRDDADKIRELGRSLNRVISNFAKDKGYVYVSVEDGFAGHGYCSGDSFFVFAEDSCMHQGEIGQGTMHPNKRGLRVYGNEIAAALKGILIPESGGSSADASDAAEAEESNSTPQDSASDTGLSSKEEAGILNVAKKVQQWSFGVTRPRTAMMPQSMNSPSSSKRYNLKNYKVDGAVRYLQYEKTGTGGGINLGWTNDATNSTGEKVARWFFVRPSGSRGPLRYGEKLALGYFREGSDDPFIQYEHRNVGINLDWSQKPIFEWTILGGTVGAPVDTHARVALFNFKHDEFLIYFDQPDLTGPLGSPGDIGWPDSETWGDHFKEAAGTVFGKGWGFVKNRVKDVLGMCPL